MTTHSSSLNRYTAAVFCALTITLSFAAYFLPFPREVLPFVIVCIPAVIAILLAGAMEGGAGVRTLLRKLGEWRITVKWLAIALALTIAMRLAISLIALLLRMIPSIQLRSGTPVDFVLLAVIFLVAGLLEELGWRGYVLPKLLETRSALSAGLISGLQWGLVHLALHLPGMPNDGLPIIPTLLQLLGLSVILTWFFVQGGRNILLTTIVHAGQSFFVILNGGVTLEAQQWLMAVVWVAAAAIIILASPAMQRVTAPVVIEKRQAA